MAQSSDAARQYSRATPSGFDTSCTSSSASPASAATRRTPATSGARPSGWRPTCASWASRMHGSCRPPAIRSSTASGWARGRTSRPCWSTATTTWCRRRSRTAGTRQPFEPVVKDGKIYARGATDDKGQLFIHVKALESYLKTGDGPPVNVKFLLEGEEEVSSPNLRPFIEAHLDLLKADVCVISDSSMPTIDEPAITHSLRGMTYIEIDVEGPHDDLHSGFYGGAVHNPALALVEILAQAAQPRPQHRRAGLLRRRRRR